MKRSNLIALGAAGAAAAAAATAALAAGLLSRRKGEIIEIDTGLLSGVRRGDVLAFLGIPYAAPPVGALRWRPPQAALRWDGVRPADRLGPIAPQKHDPQDNGVGPPPMSEDCLTLNVWRPVERAELLPVMVWIHGGGFTTGSATAALYDGAGLARQGVMVVTLNYRLGRLGFFAHPALSAEDPKGLKGNYGLMDQIAALQWVQRNISAFGGDPDNVTLFGESAGGLSVNRLMLSPLARGLFHKAISQSGAGREKSPSLKAAEAHGVAFAASLGLPEPATPAALRALSVEQILEGTGPDLGLGGGPILDGALLPQDVGQAFERGEVARIPYLAGFNALEFPVPGDVLDRALKRLTHLSEQSRAKIEKAYPSQDAYKTNVVSDVFFVEPARTLAGFHAKNGQSAYLYRFAVLAKAAAKLFAAAPHASEREYVFRNLKASRWAMDAADERAAERMSAYWVAFAKTGDPNGDGRPAWPAYDAKRDILLEFTNDGAAAIKTPDAKVLNAIAATYAPKPKTPAAKPTRPSAAKKPARRTASP